MIILSLLQKLTKPYKAVEVELKNFFFLTHDNIISEASVSRRIVILTKLDPHL